MILSSVLVARHYRYDPADPHWPDRDRLIAPTLPDHGALTLQSAPGLAFGAAVGMAIAERMLAARFGRSLVDHRIWLLAEPRDLVSGTAQEAACVAGALMLGRLVVLAALPANDPRLTARFTAAGWTVREVAAGDHPAADAALSACARSQKPTLVLEFGEPGPCAGTVPHPAGLHAPEPTPPEPPTRSDPEPAGAAKRNAGARRAWLKRLRRHANREAFQHALAGHLPLGWQKSAHVEDAPAPSIKPAALSTDAAIRAALLRLAAILPDLATLPLYDPPQPSPSSPTPRPPPPQGGAFAGRTLSWDGMELAASACTLGMALHGGLHPQSWPAPDSVALALPAMQLAAYHGARALYIVSMPATAPAAMPDVAAGRLHVLTPADAAEATDCLILAMRRIDAPSLLVLSAAAPPVLPAAPRLCARGAYLLHAPGSRDLTILAAGPALETALRVHAILTPRGVQTALVSVPCLALFDAQEESYRRMVLGRVLRIAIGPARSLSGLADLKLDCASDPDPEQLAARILRHVHRSA